MEISGIKTVRRARKLNEEDIKKIVNYNLPIRFREKFEGKLTQGAPTVRYKIADDGGECL